jgi:hypothetical protein
MSDNREQQQFYWISVWNSNTADIAKKAENISVTKLNEIANDSCQNSGNGKKINK